MALLAFVFPISALAIGTENTCFILPPLIVTFTEFAHSKAGFRNRPVQIFFILVGSRYTRYSTTMGGIHLPAPARNGSGLRGNRFALLVL